MAKLAEVTIANLRALQSLDMQAKPLAQTLTPNAARRTAIAPWFSAR